MQRGVVASTNVSAQQETEIRIRYVDPMFDALVQALDDEDLPLGGKSKAQVLAELMSLVTQDNNQYDKERRSLRIDSDFAQQDDILLVGIREVLPKSSTDEQDYIYKILYKLLHEFRFNKNPNSPLDDERNALMANQARSADELYARTVQIIGTLAQRVEARINGDNPGGKQIPRLTDQEIETIVLKRLRQLQQQHAPITTNSNNQASSATETASKKHKAAASSANSDQKTKRVKIDHDDDDDDDVQLQIDADYAAALQLQQMLEQTPIPKQQPVVAGSAPALLVAAPTRQNSTDRDLALAMQLQQEEDARLNGQLPVAAQGEETLVDQLARQAYQAFGNALGDLRKKFF